MKENGKLGKVVLEGIAEKEDGQQEAPETLATSHTGCKRSTCMIQGAKPKLENHYAPKCY